MMTLEEAIRHCEEVVKENDDSAKEFYRVSKLETHPDRKRAEDGYVECKECAKEYRQLAEWLKELKAYKEQDGDTISRQAAIHIASGYCHPANIADELAKLPSAQPERKKGYWIESHEHTYIGNGVKEWTNWYCSECDAPNDKPTDFCPNCGAEMVEPQESGDEA